MRTGFIATVILLATDPEPLSGQPACPVGSPGAHPMLLTPVMETLLEKTIFKVDVLTLRIATDPATARAVAALARVEGATDAMADSVIGLVLRAPTAEVLMTFVRNVKLGQFLDGIDDNMATAVKAGWLQEEDYTSIMAGLPEAFAFLAERGVRRGDQVSYCLHGDTLRTRYRDPQGMLYLDQVDIGPERRRSVLGSYLAPRSGFRKGLIRSLLTGAPPP